MHLEYLQFFSTGGDPTCVREDQRNALNVSMFCQRFVFFVWKEKYIQSD